MPGKQRDQDVIHLSAVNPDPVASMRIWGSTVTLGGKDFTVPAMDAAGWLELLLEETIAFEGLFPGLAGPQATVEVNHMLMSGQVPPEGLEGAILDLLEAVSGRRWWITLRLCLSLRSNWESVGGELARNGVTPFGVPLSYWLDAAYTTMIDLMLKGPKPKSAADWSRALTLPPPSEVRDIDDKANADAFLAALRASQ